MIVVPGIRRESCFQAISCFYLRFATSAYPSPVVLYNAMQGDRVSQETHSDKQPLIRLQNNMNLWISGMLKVLVLDFYLFKELLQPVHICTGSVETVLSCLV